MLFVTNQCPVLFACVHLPFLYTPYPYRKRGVEREVGNDGPERSVLCRIPAELPVHVEEHAGDCHGCVAER